MHSTKVVPVRSLQVGLLVLFSTYSLSNGSPRWGARLISLSHNPVIWQTGNGLPLFLLSCFVFPGHASPLFAQHIV